MRIYYHTSEGQFIVDRTFSLFPFFIGLFVKAFIYSPLLLTGYIVCRQILPTGAKGYYWVGIIIVVALVIYRLLFILKGIIIAWRARGHQGWILLLGLCVIYTSVPPGIITYHFLQHRVPYPWLTWALTVGAGCWVYTRYHFLTDLVPQRMWGLYLTGLKLGKHPRL